MLRSEGWIDIIDEMLRHYSFFITDFGKVEFLHRFPEESEILDRIAILPTLNTEVFERFSIKFDNTDASLIEYSEIKGYLIVTEDKVMLQEAYFDKRKIIQLIDFFVLLLGDGFLYYNEILKLAKIFRGWKNITNHKMKQIKRLQQY
jgi:hypothetical protein